ALSWRAFVDTAMVADGWMRFKLSAMKPIWGSLSDIRSGSKRRGHYPYPAVTSICCSAAEACAWTWNACGRRWRRPSRDGTATYAPGALQSKEYAAIATM